MQINHCLLKIIKILPVNIILRIIFTAVIVFLSVSTITLSAQALENEPIQANNKEENQQSIQNQSKLKSEKEGSENENTTNEVDGSLDNEEGLGTKMDQMHTNLFNLAEGQVKKVDSWFRAPGEELIQPEQSHFRLGLFAEFVKKRDDNFKLKQAINFDANIELPNLVHHLKLIITTNDPTALPGRDVTAQQDRSLRTALSKQWASNISTAIGVRARWKTPLFAYATWSPNWKNDDWQIYPQEKLFWDNRNGIGEITTLVFDHWTDRWNTRVSSSVKWSKQDYDSDRKSGRNDYGFRWSEVFIFDHASELLDESQLGRIVSGEDIMRGWGIRLAAFGGFHYADEYQTGIFYRFPLLKKWMYFLVQPELDWKRQDNWKPQSTIRFGLDLLFWGGEER
jgi:hypothetical protein